MNMVFSTIWKLVLTVKWALRGFAASSLVLGCGAVRQSEKIITVPPPASSVKAADSAVLDLATAKAVSADELYTIYSQDLNNGANPYQRFLDRTLLVTGVFDGVNHGLAPEVFLELRTHDPGAYTYAELRPDASSLLATLQPGTRVRLLCRGDGMTIGSPILRDCRSV